MREYKRVTDKKSRQPPWSSWSWSSGLLKQKTLLARVTKKLNGKWVW